MPYHRDYAHLQSQFPLPDTYMTRQTLISEDLQLKHSPYSLANPQTPVAYSQQRTAPDLQRLPTDDRQILERAPPELDPLSLSSSQIALASMYDYPQSHPIFGAPAPSQSHPSHEPRNSLEMNGVAPQNLDSLAQGHVLLDPPRHDLSSPPAKQGQMERPKQRRKIADPHKSRPDQPGGRTGRTNTPWTKAEEDELTRMCVAKMAWPLIFPHFPYRTDKAVRKRWYKEIRSRKIDNTEDFKHVLQRAIRDYEHSKWKIIGEKVGKPAKVCEEFAAVYLDASTP